MNILSGQWVLSRLMFSWAEIAILIKNCHCRVSLYEWLCQVEYTNLEVEFCAKLCNPGRILSYLYNLWIFKWSTSLTIEENIFHILTISVFEKLCVDRQTIVFVRSIDRLVYKTQKEERRGQLWSSRGEETYPKEAENQPSITIRITSSSSIAVPSFYVAEGAFPLLHHSYYYYYFDFQVHPIIWWMQQQHSL